MGGNSLSKHHIQPWVWGMSTDSARVWRWAGWRGTGLPKPSRETKLSGANADREKFIFPVQLTTCRMGNLTRLIHTLASLSMEMSRLTRDGTAEPVSRDQTLKHARGQRNIHFPRSADHEQDWQPYPVDPYSAICDDHNTYIHICSPRRPSGLLGNLHTC